MRWQLASVVACVLLLGCTGAQAQRGSFGGAAPARGFGSIHSFPPGFGGFPPGTCCPGSFAPFGRPGPFRRRFHNDFLAPAFFPFFFDAEESRPEIVSTEPQVVIVRDERTPARVPVPPAAAKMIEVPDTGPHAPASTGPAVLVMRDGRQMEVSRYTIMGDYLYDSSRPRQTSRIPLDSVDLEATMHQNALRGIQFRLPTDPGEVVVSF